MAESLAEAGNELSFCDLRTELAAELAAKHRGAAATAAEIARRADAAVLSLPGPAESEAVLANLLAAVPPGFLIIDTTTATRAHSREMARLAAAKRVDYLDAPVSRGGRGGLTTMVGGARTAFDRARPLLAQLAQTVCYVGPSGAGTAMKLVGQSIYVTYLAAFAEGLSLAEAYGISQETALACLGPAAAGDPLIATMYDAIHGRSGRSFPVSHAVQYFDYADATFAGLDAAKPILDAAAASLRRALAQGIREDLIASRHRYLVRS
jgi:3-hydroxyisobutyrate dehydrogenase-like beta-hydroxyacid dehydrogenase